VSALSLGIAFGDFQAQAGTGVSPMFVGRGVRDSQNLGSLPGGQAGKIAELD
jgi:hypothetical protein